MSKYRIPDKIQNIILATGIIAFLLSIIFLCTSCSSSQKKPDLPKNDTIGEIVENIETEEQLEIVSRYKLYNLLNYIIVSSLVGIGICIVVFLTMKSAGGILGSIACGIILILALAVKSFSAILAVIGVVLLILLLVLAIIFILRNKEALIQVIQSYEKVKEEITEVDARTRIKVAANTIQTDITQAKIKKIREKL